MTIEKNFGSRGIDNDEDRVAHGGELPGDDKEEEKKVAYEKPFDDNGNRVAHGGELPEDDGTLDDIVADPTPTMITHPPSHPTHQTNTNFNPQTMEEAGFEVCEYEDTGAEIILFPTLQPAYYVPSGEGKFGVGVFTRKYFDPSTKTLHLESDDGEKSVIEILPDRGLVICESEYLGQKESLAWAFEPNQRLRDVIRWRDAGIPQKDPKEAKRKFRQVPGGPAGTDGFKIDYNELTRELKVTIDNVGEVYKQKLTLPEDVRVDILLDRYIKITDTTGMRFTGTNYAGPGENDFLFVTCTAGGKHVQFESQNGQTNLISTCLTGITSSLVTEAIYNAEFDAKSTIVDINGNPLKVKGPCRDEFCEISSGKSSLLYSPFAKRAILWRGWNKQGVKSEIKAGSVENGAMIVNDKHPDGSEVSWKLGFNFYNNDADKAYTATKM